MSNIIAVIPVKGLLEAKSRLANLLSLDARRRLVLAMLDDVSSAVAQSGSVAKVFIVTPDEAIKEIAYKLGVAFFLESRNGLNGALEEVCNYLLGKFPTHATMIVPADVPLLTSRIVDEIAHVLDEKGSPLVVATRSRDGGTNVLLRSPHDAIPVSFGPGSFEAHRRFAEGKKVTFVQYRSPQLELDVDTVGDLRELASLDPSTKSQQLAYSLLKPGFKPESGV